jgi:hypothetical protein
MKKNILAGRVTKLDKILLLELIVPLREHIISASADCTEEYGTAMGLRCY